MLHACLPLDFTQGDPVRDAGAHEDFAYHLARSRAVAGTGADFAAWKLRSASGLTVSLNAPRRSRGTVTMVAKWRFLDEGHPRPWGGDTRIRLQGGPGLLDGSRILRCKVSKSAAGADPALLERDIALLDAAITLLMEGTSHDRPATLADRPLLEQNPGLGPEIAGAVRDGIALNGEADREKKAAARRLVAGFSALPDGTPIVIRGRGSSAHGGVPTLQLGLKSGRACESLARNAMIAPEAFLRGDALRQAGLSAHDALPLLAAAARARGAHPGRAVFATGTSDIPANAILHPGQPFHESFLAARRKLEPAAWMQTATPSSTGIIYRIDGPEPDWRFNHLGHRLAVLPKTTSGPVILAETRRYRDEGPGRFARLASLWCVPREVADLLARHDMGGIVLRPLEIRDRDGASLPGGWCYLAADSFMDAVDKGRTVGEVLKYSAGRTVQPFEVVLVPETGDRPDIWFDATVRSGSLFLSDRLYRELKRARALPRAALKPCRG